MQDKIDAGVAAALAELHRQAEISGCVTEDDGTGTYVQIDGSWKIRPVVEAILKATAG